MKQFLAGGIGAILLAGAGLFFWQIKAEQKTEIPDPPPELSEEERDIEALSLPVAGKGSPRYGAKPPSPLSAPKASREEKRFNRYDRDRDDLISRLEMMSSRTKAFKKLDRDGNYLLSFEEWAEATSERFAKADSNRDRLLTRVEFASTKPKQSAKPKCGC